MSEQPLSRWPWRMPQRETMKEIATRSAERHGLILDDLKSGRRHASISAARMEAMFEIYATGNFSYPQIGRFFNRDHTTVLYACRRVGGWTALEAHWPRAIAQQGAA